MVNDSGSTVGQQWKLLRLSSRGIMSEHEPREPTLEPKCGTPLQKQQIQKSRDHPTVVYVSTGLCRTGVQQCPLVVQRGKRSYQRGVWAFQFSLHPVFQKQD